MAIEILLKGVDITSSVDFKSVQISDSMEVTGDTMNFSVYGDSQDVVPAVGNEVTLNDGSTKEFGGMVTEISRSIGEGNQIVIYNCTAIDYTFMLNRRYLNKVYSQKKVSDGANDSIVEDILYDLKQASGSADQFYNDFYSNLSDTGADGIVGKSYVSEGPTVRQHVFNRITPSQAFSTLAQATAMIWWIDFDKRINFRQATEMFADHLPVVDGDPAIHVENDISSYYDMTLEDSIQGLGTKAIIKDAVIKSVTPMTHPYKITEIDARAVDATPVAGEGVRIFLPRRPFSELDIGTIIRVRSGQPNLTFVNSLDDIARDADDNSASATNGSFYAFIYVGRQGQNNSYVRLCTDAIAENDEILIPFNYATNDDHENIDVSRITEAANATGGDGFHEFVFSQGSEIAVTGLEPLDEISKILLDRKSKIMRRGSFRSLKKGWKAGQIFWLKWDREGLNEMVWCLNLNKTILTPSDDPILSDNVIETSISFANMPRGMRL